MLPIRCQRMLQIWRPLSLCGAAVRFALFALLVVILGDRSFSQRVYQRSGTGQRLCPVRCSLMQLSSERAPMICAQRSRMLVECLALPGIRWAPPSTRAASRE